MAGLPGTRTDPAAGAGINWELVFTGKLDIAVMPSLVRKGEVNPLAQT